jgi:ASCH domain.
MEHHLKTWPQLFEAVASGVKTFDIRVNNRNFQTGDILVLEEWDPKTQLYSGRALCRRVGFLLQGEFGLAPNTCCMSLLPENSVSSS